MKFYDIFFMDNNETETRNINTQRIYLKKKRN